MYWKCNLFFDSKTKWILKFFSFFVFQFHYQNWKNERTFWNSFFDLKSKNEFENFDFCFLKLVVKQNRLKKEFFLFSFNDQNWKMKDAFSNLFFHFKSKNELQNCKFHFTKSVINQNMKNWKVVKTNTNNLSRIITIAYRLKTLMSRDNKSASWNDKLDLDV